MLSGSTAGVEFAKSSGGGAGLAGDSQKTSEGQGRQAYVSAYFAEI